VPVHLQQAHADLGYLPGDFPEAERAARTVLSLPMFPELGAEQAARVAAAVTEHAYV
jgi:dTDP-4-amino-4,6-dideoxygalactose transaminase